MRNPTSYGTVSLIDKKSKRRNPYRVQIHVGWTDEGKPIRKTVGYAKTRAEGRQMLAEYHDKPFDTDIKNATWKYVYNKWLEYKKETNISKAGLDHYINAYKKTTSLDLIPFNEINLATYQRVINSSGVKNDGQKRIRNLYHQLYEFAKILNIPVNNDISLFLNVEPEEKSTKHVPFSNEEIKSLFNNRNAMIDIIIFMIYTGIRPNELFKISEYSDDYIITGSKTEAGKNRTIPIHDKIKPIWKDIQKSGTIALLTTNRFYKAFKIELERLNINHVPYDTRHTFATLWKLSGADDYARKKIMGHSEKDLTNNVYTHLDFEFLKKNINKIAIEF